MSPPEQYSSVVNVTRDGNLGVTPDPPADDGSLTYIDVSMSYIAPLALKAALILGVPDILVRHPRPLTVEEILLEIPGCKDNRDPQAARNLRSILVMLVHYKAFSEFVDESGTAPKRYGLTPVSKLLVTNPEAGYTPLQALSVSAHENKLKAWNHLHETVLDSSSRPFVAANGQTFWDEISKDPDVASVFHHTLKASVQQEHSKILQHYDGWRSVQTLVDVGGSLGGLIGAIVQAQPHIRGINFDLPHVIAGAPEIPGVVHIAGDFFETVPKANAIIMKCILHDWNDEQCIKILQTCKKALPNSGKVIICEQILVPASNLELRAKVGHMMNLTMLTLLSGKERYAEEWVALISAAGFPRHRIITIPNSYLNIIEAFVL